MPEVDFSELRDDTDVLFERVVSGESITITVAGRPVAALAPVSGRTRFMDRDRFIREILAHRADPALLTDIRALTLDPTSDLSSG